MQKLNLTCKIKVTALRKNGSKFPFWKDVQLGDEIVIATEIYSYNTNYSATNIRNGLVYINTSPRRFMGLFNSLDWEVLP